MSIPRARTFVSTLFLASLLGAAVPALAVAGTASLAGSGLEYAAGSGEQNTLRVTYDSGAYTVTDPAGVASGAGCTPSGPTAAVCTVTTAGAPHVSATLGDGNDYGAVSGAASTVDGGSGHDRLVGSGRDDTLIGGSGPDTLNGGLGQDSFVAGSGNDRILARDAFADQVACGSGRDSVQLDGLDYFGDRCERVRRSDRAGATLVRLTADAAAGTARLRVGCPRDSARCVGKASLREGGRTLDSARFRLSPAHLRSLRVQLGGDVAGRLRSGQSVRVTVVLATNRGRLRRRVTVSQTLVPPG